MEPIHLAHVVALGMWLGVVITEVLFEFAGSDPDSLRAAARFHYNVDKYGELPILFAVLVTGAILMVRACTSSRLRHRWSHWAPPCCAFGGCSNAGASRMRTRC
jgi:hypothetical protein